MTGDDIDKYVGFYFYTVEKTSTATNPVYTYYKTAKCLDIYSNGEYGGSN